MDAHELRRVFALASAFKEGDLAIGGTSDEHVREQARQALLATRVADIVPGPDSSEVRGITRIGFNRVAFTAVTPEHGYELWESDGTSIGTRRVSDIAAVAFA